MSDNSSFDNDTTTRRYIITGRVQGVWFRDSTRQQAVELGISGYAANLPDGTVEVLARGPRASVQALHSWLHEGPPLAVVDRVEEVDVGTNATARGFEIR